jgi:hypothetical protein
VCSILSEGGGGPSDASTAQLVEAARLIAAEIAGRAAPDSGGAAVEHAEALGRVIDLLEAALAPLVRRADATGAPREAGFATTAAWLRGRLGMRDGRATERVRLARQLSRLVTTAGRLARGELPFGHAAVIAEAVSRLADADATAGESVLLDLVDAGHSAGELARDAARITDLIIQHRGGEREPGDSRRGFSRSWLTVSRSLDGGAWVRGWLTPEHGAQLDEIVGPLAKPSAAGDDRDLGQRTADALFSVLTQGNGSAGVTVIVDLAAYAKATDDPAVRPVPADWAGPSQGPPNRRSHGSPGDRPGDRHVDRRGGRLGDRFGDCDRDCPGEAGEAGEHSGRQRPPGGRGRPAARFLNGAEISPARARQIALTAGVSALILGPSGVPLYLCRRQRFATSGQRKALLAMYETCCVKGCRIPAHLSEIHHLGGGWKFGTPTDVNRLAPACGWHNRWIADHPDRVAERRDPQGRYVLTLLRSQDRASQDRAPQDRAPQDRASPLAA